MSIIYGEHIRLRAVEREDLKKYHEWLNDPEVTEGTALYLPMSMVEEENWFDAISQLNPNEKPLAIDLRKDREWKLIGSCGFHVIEQKNRCAEIGIVIGDKTEWNKGYGSETVTLLQRHGFETLNLNRIFLRVYADNIRAVRSYEKAGFVLEGRLREATYKKGKYEDVLLMGILRSEWFLPKKKNEGEVNASS